MIDLKKKVYHHLGIYCYSVSTLEKFINLPQTENEKKNRLEQLRALNCSSLFFFSFSVWGKLINFSKVLTE